MKRMIYVVLIAAVMAGSFAENSVAQAEPVSDDAKTLKASADTIDIMRRVLSRAISNGLKDQYASTEDDSNKVDEKDAVKVEPSDGTVNTTYFRDTVLAYAYKTTQANSYGLELSTKNMRGYCVPGHGAFFSMDVNIPMMQEQLEQPENVQGEVDDEWEAAKNEKGRMNQAQSLYNVAVSANTVFARQSKQARVPWELDPDAIEVVTDSVIQAVARHGLKIEGLDDDESIVVALVLHGVYTVKQKRIETIFVPSYGASVEQMRLVIEVTRSDIKKYTQKRLDADGVKSRARITQY